MARVFVDRSGTMPKDEVEKTVYGFKERIPIGRVAAPEDIANVALFLASEEAAYVNGVILPVDGGTIVRY